MKLLDGCKSNLKFLIRVKVLCSMVSSHGTKDQDVIRIYCFPIKDFGVINLSVLKNKIVNILERC